MSGNGTAMPIPPVLARNDHASNTPGGPRRPPRSGTDGPLHDRGAEPSPVACRHGRDRTPGHHLQWRETRANDRGDGLNRNHRLQLPPSLVEAEAKQIAHQLFHDENPDIEGHDHEEVKPSKEHNKLAERRVRL